MGLITYRPSRVRGVVDESSIERAGGHLVDWASVTAGSDGAKRLTGLQVVSRRADGKLQPRSHAVTLTSVVVASNVATATLVNHGFSIGEQITISGANLAYANGTVTIASVPDADTFTYAATGANATATGTIVASRVAVGLIETNAAQDAREHALTGYSLIVGGVLYETLLPDATGSPKKLPAQYVTELKAAGCTFKLVPYVDSRAD